ncbi:hypothetical protein E2C01_089691 [Portunus trituberculatus]|uniref:Uncharacterized protein n=1 Tax=Portunus trituberculatus TaxID=210409 RepID=A0A5B7JI58_PORTR|nr:hypothetical protein [Portunus trituberculatus]
MTTPIARTLLSPPPPPPPPASLLRHAGLTLSTLRHDRYLTDLVNCSVTTCKLPAIHFTRALLASAALLTPGDLPEGQLMLLYRYREVHEYRQQHQHFICC